MEAAVGRGLHAAGFISYEAAPGLNPDLTPPVPPADLPLLWFGIFAETPAIPPGQPIRQGAAHVRGRRVALAPSPR